MTSTSSETEHGDTHEANGTATNWHVGSAKRTITPTQSMRMAGFSKRTDRSDGTLMDLHARAIVLKDGWGKTAAIVSAEVLFITRDIRAAVERRVREEHGIDPKSLVLNATHTHYGPEFREMKSVIYGLDESEREQGQNYRNRLVEELVDVIGEALSDLEPVTLQFGHAQCGIGMNRRYPTEEGIKFQQNPDGPTDHDVPVLAAYRDDDPVAMLFSYACHPTCLPIITKYSGDWAGHAMENLETHYDPAIAIFVQGCGGDVKAYPQGTKKLAAQHGRTLSNSVRAALDAPTTPVTGPIRSVYKEITLEVDGPPSREELEGRLAAENGFERRRATVLLDQLESSGEIPTEYPYPIQALGFGNDVTMVMMAGEVLAEYSLMLKERLESTIWPLGYSNADFTYVPTRRALYEGGYEGGGVIKYTAFPGPPKPDTEDRIVETALALAERVGARRTNVH